MTKYVALLRGINVGGNYKTFSAENFFLDIKREVSVTAESPLFEILPLVVVMVLAKLSRKGYVGSPTGFA